VSLFRGKTAVITGASAGLGEEFAVQLVDLGISRIVLTARRAERLASLQAILCASNPALRVDAITADLSDPADVTSSTTPASAISAPSSRATRPGSRTCSRSTSPRSRA
jgi:short-subunit dehydrogenase